jgi:hypothetical protein
MPFTSKTQKKTVGSAAKKMPAKGKSQTKFQEATDTVEKDEKGNVKSWKHEGDWVKSGAKKDPRGKVTNASDKARRKTEKMSKPEKEMAEAFEKAISEVKVTSGPHKGKEWSPKTPGPTNPDFKDDGSMGPSDGATAPPPGYKPPKTKSMKKAEIEQPTQVAATGDDETIAETKKKPSKIKVAMKNNKIKALKENIKLVSQLLAEAKKADKCSCKTNEDTCKVHSKMKEGLKGGQKKLDVAPPKGKLTGADFKALKGKKKTEKTDEAVDQNKDGKNDFEDVKIARMKAAMKGKSKKVDEATKEKEPEGTYSKKRFETDGQRVARLAKEKRQAEKKKKEEVKESKDVYMESLYQKLVNQLKG